MENTVKTLVDQYQERMTERRAKAVSLYWELLLRSGSPQPGDPDKLEEAMVVLDRTPDDLLNDQALVLRLSQYEQLAENVENLQQELQRKHVAWSKANQEGEQARKKLEEKIEATLAPLAQARTNTEAQLTDARHAKNNIAHLRDEWQAIVENTSVEELQAPRRREGLAESTKRHSSDAGITARVAAPTIT